MSRTENEGRFIWLREPHGRRSSLIAVERSLAEGWNLDENVRTELATGLRELLESGGLSARESARVFRILEAMDLSDATEWTVMKETTLKY